jgi:hypothetical protein
VIYYGSLISSQEPHVARQIARFLGLTRDSPRWNLDDKPRERLQWAEDNDGRRIVFARALGQDVSNTYMILGSTDDLDRNDRWLARGARAYRRATIHPAEALKVMLLADGVDVSVVNESVPRLRAARRAQLGLDLISKPSALTRREHDVLGLMRL